MAVKSTAGAMLLFATPTGNTHKFMGIRNGIDTELWSPTENRFLPMEYDADTAEQGKRRWAQSLSVWQSCLVLGAQPSTGMSIQLRCCCRLHVHTFHCYPTTLHNTAGPVEWLCAELFVFMFVTGRVRSCASGSTCLTGTTRPSSQSSAG